MDCLSLAVARAQHGMTNRFRSAAAGDVRGRSKVNLVQVALAY